MSSFIGKPLTGSSVLLISPHFFSYEKTIMHSIESLGGRVFYIDERPGNSFLTKGIIRVNSKLIGAKIRSYYESCLSAFGEGEQFDQILIISPEAIDKSILSDIKKRFPHAKMVLYMWDSIRNKTGNDNTELLPYFDTVLSFDKEDCAVHPEMQFRPLFFSQEYEKLPELNSQAVYDISFIGSIHSDRFAVCSGIRSQAKRMGLRVFFYLYFHDKKLYWYSKLTNSAMKGSKVSDFIYSPMPAGQVVEVISQSRCILDIQHPDQTGLTMRTIEILGARRKLLTTNTAVTQYDFYNACNISCFDRNNLEFSREFVISPYKKIDQSIYEKYSAVGWLKDVLLS